MRPATADPAPPAGAVVVVAGTVVVVGATVVVEVLEVVVVPTAVVVGSTVVLGAWVVAGTQPGPVEPEPIAPEPVAPDAGPLQALACTVVKANVAASHAASRATLIAVNRLMLSLSSTAPTRWA